MKNEYLFRALGDVGDDLIHKAETQRFRNPWKNWVSMAAAVAVVISLGALALPYFPSGCSASKSAATESAAEVPKYTFTADMMDQEKPEIIEEESLTEAVPENEMALTAPSPGASEDGMMNSAMESAAQTDVIQITVCSTVYYLQPGMVDSGETPEKLGQQIGIVETSDNESYLGCPIYEVADTTWYSNHAVDGQSVPSEILVEGPNGWIAGFTGNEKTVARYTVTDVQAAMDAGDYDWIMQTFVQPVESQQVRLLDGRSEDSEMLNRLFLASLQLNTGVSVDLAWRMRCG